MKMRVLLFALILAFRGIYCGNEGEGKLCGTACPRHLLKITEEQARLMKLPKFPKQMYGIVSVVQNEQTSGRFQLPLQDISVSVETQGLIAHVETKFRYENFSNRVIENTEFIFPLDSEAAVYSLKVKCGSSPTIEALIQEKGKAKKVYDNAVRDGYMATHMEQNLKMPDVFKFSLGNIAKNTKCVATFKYVQEMYKYNFDGLNTMFFRYPVELSHRYGDTSGVTDQAQNKEYGFNFEFKVNEKDSETKVIETDERLIVTEDNKSLVFDKKREFKKDVDIFITIAEDKPIAILEYGKTAKTGWFSNWWSGESKEGIELKKDSILMVNLNPKFNAESVAEREFVMVLDRSYSMAQGDREATAKDTVLEWIEGLPTTDSMMLNFPDKKTCTFNIVSFGHNFKKWRQRSVKCTKENKEKAKEHVKTFKSDLGGTEIRACLEHVLKTENETGMKQVFLVTDGEVSDTKEVIEVAHRYEDSSRIFSFGIGHGASSELVHGIAKANGMSYMIKDNEIGFLKRAVGHALTNAKSEYFTDIEVRVKGIDSKKMTKIPFGLFQGAPFSVYARVPSNMSEKDVVVTMTAKNSKGERIGFPEVHASVHVETQQELKFPLHRLAAKKFISEWVSPPAVLYLKPGQTLTKLGEKVLAVSKEMNILSEVSSFVGTGDKVLASDRNDGFEQSHGAIPKSKSCGSNRQIQMKYVMAEARGSARSNCDDQQLESATYDTGYQRYEPSYELETGDESRADDLSGRQAEHGKATNKKSKQNTNENSSNAFSVFFFLYIIVLMFLL